jgi:hypothetical protein
MLPLKQSTELILKTPADLTVHIPRLDLAQKIIQIASGRIVNVFLKKIDQ